MKPRVAVPPVTDFRFEPMTGRVCIAVSQSPHVHHLEYEIAEAISLCGELTKAINRAIALSERAK